MRYLVIGELKETPPMPVEQHIELVIPSLEALAAQEKAGKVVAGGVPTGRRAGCYVVEAESHEEVDRFLSSLPFWGILDWEIIPLISTEKALERTKTILAKIKAQKK